LFSAGAPAERKKAAAPKEGEERLNMSWFRRWGSRVLLPAGLLLTVSSTAAARGAGVYEALVDTSAVDSSLEWAGGALVLYLDSFVGAAAESGSVGPQPFAAKVRLLTEGEDLVYLVRLENEAGMIADGELRGDPGQVAEWLTELAVIIERAAFPARESPVAWDAPTSSTGALRRFLEAGRSADFKEKERLLREALAADPSFLEARWQLGVVQYALGGYEDALDAFEAYLAARPSSSRAAHNSGLSAARLGRKRMAAVTESEETKRLFLAPYGTSSPGVWMTELPEIGPVRQEREGGQHSGPVSGAEEEPVGGVSDLEERLGRAEEESEKLRMENEGLRDRNRALADVLREKDRQAIQLAKEALAAQKGQREAVERVRILEDGLGAQALAALRVERDALVEERRRLEERLAGQEGRVAEFEKEKSSLESRSAELGKRVSELEGVRGGLEVQVKEREGRLQELQESAGAFEEREAGLVREREELRGRIAALEGELKSAGEEVEKARADAGSLAAVQAERDALVEERLTEQKEQAAAVSRELEREKEALVAELESVRGDFEARIREARDELNAERKRSTGIEREKESLVLLKKRLAGKMREMALRLMALDEATSALP
jgi:hypothetical protein